MRRAVIGISCATAGFHTPNHRWADRLCAGVGRRAAARSGGRSRSVDAYLAEGIDIDAEGAYLERSIGVYDGVTNRSLLLLADY